MRLPDYKMVSGGNTRVNMSAGAAGQVGRAFASMGKDLQNAGMEVAGAFEEAEKQHNAGKMADWQLELDEAYSNYQQDMASNPNNALEWRDGFTKMMQGKRSELEKRDISRNLKDQQSDYLKGFEGKYGIQVSNKMHSTILDNSRDSVQALIINARLKKDYDGAERQVDEAERNGLLSGASALEQRLAIGRERQAHNVSTLIIQDAYSAEDNFLNGSVSFDSEADRDKAVRDARSRQAYNESVTTDEINETIYSGQPITEEEIDEAFHPDANIAKAKAKNTLREFNDLSLQERRAKPQYQERLDGELHRLTQDLDVTASGFQDQRRDVVDLIEQITHEPTKAEWKRVLSRIDAREPKFQTAADSVIEKLGKEGSIKIPKLKAEEVTFMQYARDGHLGIKTLTEATTLPAHQIKKIDKLSREGDFDGAIKLFGKYMRPRGRGGYKADIKPWQKDFLVPLTSQKTPTLTSTAHIKEGTPAQILKFEKDKQIFSARSSRIKSDLRARLGDKKIEDVPANELDEHVRFLSNLHSEESVRQSMEEQDAEELNQGKLNINYNATGFRPDEDTLRKNYEKGQFYVSLDANKASGVPVTQPLAVIPEEASPQLKQAVSMYTSLMADLHKEEFGRDFKARIVTSGSKMGTPKKGEKQKYWRGKPFVTHLEGFAITDKEMVAFLKTPRGKAKYRQILNKSFDNIQGITLGLPHTATDSGAIDDDTKESEVSLAKHILGDTASKTDDISQVSYDSVTQATAPAKKDYKLKNKSYQN